MAKNARILIAEDEERLRRLLQMLPEHAGYDLTLAADGAEALPFSPPATSIW